MLAILSKLVEAIRALIAPLLTPEVRTASKGLLAALIAAKFPGLPPDVQTSASALIGAVTLGVLFPAPGQSAGAVMERPEVHAAIKAAVRAALEEHAAHATPAAPPAAAAAPAPHVAVS